MTCMESGFDSRQGESGGDGHRADGCSRAAAGLAARQHFLLVAARVELLVRRRVECLLGVFRFAEEKIDF